MARQLDALTIVQISSLQNITTIYLVVNSLWKSRKKSKSLTFHTRSNNRGDNFKVHPSILEIPSIRVRLPAYN